MNTRLGRLDRVKLVVDGARRAGEVVNLIRFYVQRKRYVVPEELEALVTNQVFDIAPCSREKIIDADDLATFCKQPFTQVRAEKSGPTGH
jgi:hypothetical protein